MDKILIDGVYFIFVVRKSICTKFYRKPVLRKLMSAKISVSMTVFENIRELFANISQVFTQGKTPNKTTMMGIFY